MSDKPPEIVTLKLTDLQAGLEKALQKGIENGIAMAAMATSPNKDKPKPVTLIVKGPDGKERPSAPNEICPICRQQLIGCMGEHKQMAVYPKNRRHGKYFQGVRINGVTYLSNSLQHEIWVPSNAPISHLIQQWELNEEETMNGRTYEHNSGTLGSSGGSFNPATGAWR